MFPAGPGRWIDASVCLELLALKLRHGPTFGMEQSKSQNVLQVPLPPRHPSPPSVRMRAHLKAGERLPRVDDLFGDQIVKGASRPPTRLFFHSQLIVVF